MTHAPFFFSSALPTRLTPLPGPHKCSSSSAPCLGQLFPHPTYPSTPSHSHNEAAGFLSPAAARRGTAWPGDIEQLKGAVKGIKEGQKTISLWY